jgi:hypothetical protein
MVPSLKRKSSLAFKFSRAIGEFQGAGVDIIAGRAVREGETLMIGGNLLHQHNLKILILRGPTL